MCGTPAAIREAGRFDLSAVSPLMGRGFARQYIGRQPWVPPVDLTQDKSAGAAFGNYRRAHNMRDVLSELVTEAKEQKVVGKA